MSSQLDLHHVNVCGGRFLFFKPYFMNWNFALIMLPTMDEIELELRFLLISSRVTVRWKKVIRCIVRVRSWFCRPKLKEVAGHEDRMIWKQHMRGSMVQWPTETLMKRYQLIRPILILAGKSRRHITSLFLIKLYIPQTLT